MSGLPQFQRQIVVRYDAERQKIVVEHEDFTQVEALGMLHLALAAITDQIGGDADDLERDG